MTAWPSRRALGLLALSSGLAAGAYLVFGNSDERRVLEVLRELAAAVSAQRGDTERIRARRIGAALEQRTAEALRLSIPEIGDVEGRDEVGELLIGAGALPLELSIEASTVQVDTARGRARAALTLTAVLRYPGEERRDTRAASVDLTRTPAGFRVERIQVEEKSRIEPEARP